MNNNFGIKRQTSYYIKQSKNLILDNFYNAYPEFDNLNLKLRNELTPIKQSQNNNSNNLAKNKTRIKLAGLLNMNLNLINNNINNNNIIKENKNNYVYKTDNNLIIKNQQENENKYFNIKLKPPPFKRLKIINTDLEEKNEFKEERKDNNYNKEVEYANKFNNIKNPLIQTNEKSSTNNSQSIPEIINNSGFQNQKNENISIEKENIANKKELKIIQNEYSNNNININYHYKKEKEKNLYIKEKMDKDLLLLFKPSKLNLKKKLNNLSTLNLHKRPITSLIAQNTINNNPNLIKEQEDNMRLNKSKNLSKIKLKPLVPLIRSITPFNEKPKKTEVINNNNKLKYNFSNLKFRSVNDNINEINNSSKLNNENANSINNKKSDKKIFRRKLNFDKHKLNLGNNLSPIKTKFKNFIKPNFKNFEIMNLKTEI